MSRLDTNLERLHGLYPRLIDLSLDRLRRLLADLGAPETRLPPVIHIAGTNGKGSTAAFIRAIAEAAGFSAHVYTSPHLVRFNERFRIAGRIVEDEALAAVLDEIEGRNAGNQITVFEAITAAFFILASRTPADLCVLEVGLGGRLDATNVIPRPAASAITSISLDHQEFLGSSITAIASEKAGIIKPGVPAVTGYHAPQVFAVLQAEADAAGATLLARGRDWQIAPTPDGLTYDGMQLPQPALPGAHQAENAGIAITALTAAGFLIPTSAIATGLRDTAWPARLQRLSGRLLSHLPAGSELWLDGAHNPGGAEAVAAQLQAWRTPTTVILGMKQSKDVEQFIRAIKPHAASLFAVAEPAQHLALPVDAIVIASHGAAHPGPDVAGALAQISHPTRVLICGSLYLAGEVLKLDAA